MSSESKNIEECSRVSVKYCVSERKNIELVASWGWEIVSCPFHTTSIYSHTTSTLTPPLYILTPPLPSHHLYLSSHHLYPHITSIYPHTTSTLTHHLYPHTTSTYPGYYYPSHEARRSKCSYFESSNNCPFNVACI